MTVNKLIDKNNPFKGLASFETQDAVLYQGNENVKLSLLRQLADTNFVALLGDPGSGKTSFLNARIIPTLQDGFIIKGIKDWKIAHLYPGINPIRSLARALAQVDFIRSSPNEKIDPGLIEKFEKILTHKKYGIIEILEEHKLISNCNILLNIDRLDDLFQLKKKGEDSLELDIFLTRIEEVIHQTAYPISTIVSMRSKRSYDLASSFPDRPMFIETINKNQINLPIFSFADLMSTLDFFESKGYLTFDRDVKDHISTYYRAHPISLGEFQHAMRLSVERSIENGRSNISMEDLEAVSGFKNSINNQLEDIYSTFSKEDQNNCRLLFQLLASESDLGFELFMSILEISDFTNIETDVIIQIIEEFVVDECVAIKIEPITGADQRLDHLDYLLDDSKNIITPYSRVSLDDEILIYKWLRLEKWVHDEKENSDIYQSVFTDVSKGEVLYEGEKLRSVLHWYKEVNPQKGWAKRYGINYNLVKEFIDKSEEQFNTAQRILEEEDKSRRRKAKRNGLIGIVFFLITIGLILVSVFFTGVAVDQKMEADKSKREANREKIAAEEAMNIAKEQRDRAEIASYAAKRDSIRSVEKNKEANIANSLAANALKQAEYARKDAQLLTERQNVLKIKLIESEKDIENKKIEFQYYATLGQINKICSEVLELAATPISDNLKIGANLIALGYKRLNSLDNPLYNDLIQNFPNSSIKMKAEFQVSEKNLLQAMGNVFQKLDIVLNKELSKIQFGTVLDLNKTKSTLAIGTDQSDIYEMNLPSENKFYDTDFLILNRYVRVREITSGIRSMKYIEEDNLVYGTVDGKIYRNTDQKFADDNTSKGSINGVFNLTDGDILISNSLGHLTYVQDNLSSGAYAQLPYVDIKHEINAIDFSHKSNIIATNGRLSEIEFWGCPASGDINFKEKIRIEGMTSKVTSLKFIDDKNLIIIGTQEGTLFIYSFLEDEIIFENKSAHLSALTVLALDPLSRFIVSGGRDDKINVWDIDLLSDDYVPIVHQMNQAIQDIAFIGNDWFVSLSRGQSNLGTDRNSVGRMSLWSVDLDLFAKKLAQSEKTWLIEDFEYNDLYQKYIPN
ncbi:hypothetical protein OAA00_06770 [Cyclobacteriaceae bacterium]|nr:hypothetical protein [Cyclobacteriaceae bacterium]